MEVKDVRSTNLVNEAKASRQASSKNSQYQNKSSDDAVEADVNNKQQVRVQLNAVINVTNVAKEATTQISRIVQSISGIVKQASKDDLPEQRRATLEKEANELVDEIKRTADTPASNGVRPLAGDQIRLEVEEKIGKTLDVILPDDAKDAFGLNSISFSTKESIISTITSVEKAQQQIEKLKQAVEDASKNIEAAAGSVDVALQNSEASEASIRDLDAALKLAGQTRNTISGDPDKALKSLGSLGSQSLGLLET